MTFAMRELKQLTSSGGPVSTLAGHLVSTIYAFQDCSFTSLAGHFGPRVRFSHSKGRFLTVALVPALGVDVCGVSGGLHLDEAARLAGSRHGTAETHNLSRRSAT